MTIINQQKPQTEEAPALFHTLGKVAGKIQSAIMGTSEEPINNINKQKNKVLQPQRASTKAHLLAD